MSKTKRQQHEITATAYSKNGLPLAVAKNSYNKTHPLQAIYARKVNKPNAIYLHAEIALISKLASLRKLDDVHTVVVNRRMKSGKLGLAQPCVICQRALTETVPYARIIWSE